MAAQKGRDVLIKLEIAGVYTTIGGMRQKSLQLGFGHSDVSDSDSAGQWRELLAGTGLKTMSISGAGVFKDTASEGQVLTNALAQIAMNMQFVYPGMGTFQGSYVCSGISGGGDHTNEATFSMNFDSAGQITFTAA